jgi:protein TonB
MRAASYRSSAYAARSSAGGRAVSLSLALAIAALIILALLKLGGVIRGNPGDGRPLTTFDVSTPSTSAERQSARRAQSQQRATRPQPKPATPPVRTPPPPVPVPTRLEDLQLPGVIMLSRNDYRASDIGTIKGTAPAGDANGELADGGGTSDPAIGQGPGGEPMYNAEWYREPTRAEMVTYLPTRGGPGWGMIVCRTAQRYHVEDCQELGESPGSGMARALRQAAFQFLVRPPRKGGKPMIGAWVRIRYELIEGKER